MVGLEIVTLPTFCTDGRVVDGTGLLILQGNPHRRFDSYSVRKLNKLIMNSYFILWLCSILGKLSTFFCVVGVIYFIIALIITMSYYMNDCGECEDCGIGKFVKHSFRHFVISSSMILLSCLIPSTSQCYAIFGVGTTIEYLKDSKEAKELPENAFKALNYYLKSVTPKEESNDQN